MNDGIETHWNSGGALVLEGGESLNGLVKYNQVNGLIHFKENADSRESRTFKESKILSLSFIDSEKGAKRIFYSLPYKNEDGFEEILIFEVLKEFKDWAVLSRRGKVVALEGKNDNVTSIYGGVGKNNRAIMIQQEGIFAMDQNGNIEYLQSTIYREKDGVWSSSSERSFVEKKNLQKYMNSYFEEVENFAKKNKLKIEEKNDFLKALDYYEALVSTK